jgi:hypothetical protein
LPIKVEFFALIPQKNLLRIDKNWCANQYNYGLLLQKKEFLHYQMLSALKKLAQELALT